MKTKQTKMSIFENKKNNNKTKKIKVPVKPKKTRKFRIYKRVFCSVFLLKKYRYQ